MRLARRSITWGLILILASTAVWLSGELVLAEVLTRVFARGTGCDVSLSRPRISLFPLRATVDDVLIRHPNEPRDQGFRSKRISIRLHFLRLLRKEVLLTDLVLKDATAHSVGTDSGFMRTMSFLFPMDKPDAPPEPAPSRWKRWLKTWVFHVSTIQIDSDPTVEEGLFIEVGEQRLVWKVVSLNFLEQKWDPHLPYDVVARGNDLRFISGELSPIALGPLAIRGEIGLGKLQVHEATLHPLTDPRRESLIKLTGSLGIKPPGKFDLAIDAVYGQEAFGDLMVQLGGPVWFRPASTKGKVQLTGTYGEPHLSGPLAFTFNRGVMLGLRDGCALESFAGVVDLTKHGLTVHDVSIEDLSRRGEFSLSFEGMQAVSAELGFVLDHERRWLQQCLLQDPKPTATDTRGQQPKSRDRRIYSVIGDFLADSTADVSVNGTLNPLKIDGTLRSDVAVRVKEIHSQILAKLSLDDRLATLTLSEQGVVPQIQVKPSPKAGITNAGKTGRDARVPSATEFVREANSLFGAELRYDRVRRVLEIRRAELQRYPTPALLTRIGPFLSQELFTQLTETIEPDSLVDAKLGGEIELAPPESSRMPVMRLKGALESSALRVRGVRIERLVIPIEVHDDQATVSDASLQLFGGVVRGGASIKRLADLSASTIEGRFQLSDVMLSESDEVRALLPSLSLKLGGSVDILGSAAAPRFAATLELESTKPNSARAIRHSRLRLETDQSAIRIDGDLIDDTVHLSVMYPLVAAAGTDVKLSLDAHDLPLGYLTLRAAPPEARSDTEAAGALSGHFEFHGPKNDPLLGAGSLEITRLEMPNQGISLGSGEALRADISRERLNFTNVNFRVRERTLTLTGFVDRTTGWHARLSGAWELGGLVGIIPGVEQVAGDVALELEITGPPFSPAPNGTVTVDRATVSLPLGGTVVGIEGGNLLATLEKGTLWIRELGARAGSGRLRGSGAITDIFSDERKIEVHVAFDDFIVEPVPSLALEVDGKLELGNGGDKGLALQGQIDLQRAAYEQSLTVLEMVAALARGIFARRKLQLLNENAAPDLTLDVRIRLPNGVVIETPFAQAELRGDVAVKGPARAFRVDGTIRVNEGTFGLQSRQFEVLGGQLQFVPEHRPGDAEIALVGETTVTSGYGDEYRIQMILSGTLLEPRVDFSSDAGLRREEIQSMLGLATNIEAVDILKKGKESRSIDELVNPASGLGLRDRLSGLTGFSSVHLETALSPITGEFVPRLVGRRPLVGKVDAELATELGGEQANEIRLQYPLRSRVDFLAGWYTPSVTQPGSNSNGSFYGGVAYHRTFPGSYVLPRSLFDGSLFR